MPQKLLLVDFLVASYVYHCTTSEVRKNIKTHGSMYTIAQLLRLEKISRLTVVSREAKKKQHACASSGPRDHYSEYLHGWQL